MARKPQQYRPMASGYVSEFEQFMDAFLARHPQVEQERQRAWYIWWDQHVDFDALEKQRKDTVPDKPYHYE